MEKQWSGPGGPKVPKKPPWEVDTDEGTAAMVEKRDLETGHVYLFRAAFFPYSARVFWQYRDGRIYDFWPIADFTWLAHDPAHRWPGIFYNWIIAPGIINRTYTYSLWVDPNTGFVRPELAMSDEWRESKSDPWYRILTYAYHHYGPIEPDEWQRLLRLSP